MRRMVLGWPVVASLLGFAATSAVAADPMRIDVKVVGGAPIVDDLRTCLATSLAQGGAYVLVDKLPVAELVLFANTDANDNVNTQGVSVAIAYIDAGVEVERARGGGCRLRQQDGGDGRRPAPSSRDHRSPCMLPPSSSSTSAAALVCPSPDVDMS